MQGDYAGQIVWWKEYWTRDQKTIFSPPSAVTIQLCHLGEWISTPRSHVLCLKQWRADDTTLMAESEEELKSSLDESETGEGESWLKMQHPKN